MLIRKLKTNSKCYLLQIRSLLSEKSHFSEFLYPVCSLRWCLLWSHSWSFLPAPAYSCHRCCPTPAPGAVKNGNSYQNGSTTTSQPAAGTGAVHGGHTLPVSAYSSHDQLSLVVTPSFLPQSYHCIKCPTGAVHNDKASSPASQSIIPKEMVPQQMLPEAGKDFPP